MKGKKSCVSVLMSSFVYFCSVVLWADCVGVVCGRVVGRVREWEGRI